MADMFSGNPADSQHIEDPFTGLLMADSQISELDISSQDLHAHSSSHPRRRTKRVAATHVPRRRPVSQSSGSLDSGYSEGVAPQSTAQEWEADAISVDEYEVPLFPDESQQDLAERINSLTRTINANAALCLEVSGRMIEIARENKHLYDASKSTLNDYVLQPCLKLPGILRTYYPGLQDGLQDGLEVLKEYESQLRRAVRNCANGKDMAWLQTGGSEAAGGEMKRLKDRLVEQDVLLRDSSKHVQKLIREREALRKQLEARKNKRLGEELDGHGLDGGDGRYDDPAEGNDEAGGDPGDRNMTALSDQLRELRVLVDQLALQEASNEDRELPDAQVSGHHDDGCEGSDEDSEWTLL
ncbi:hypothetical protein BX600DRAFT_511320 [Xylariales sp. PMI_506]|nr:hypothetical protein BX600DRAFT_511320 [Xylariales sp. PMI_506]